MNGIESRKDYNLGSCKKGAKRDYLHIWLISVGATLVVALTCSCYCFGQAQDLPLRLHDFLT